jgi:hypothetical protein
MEQTDPRRRRTWRGLTFADHMDRFVTGQGVLAEDIAKFRRLG